MANRDIESEVKALREQVEALMAKQSGKVETPETPSGEQGPGAGEGARHEELQRLREKVTVFAEQLQEEVKEIPAAGAVAIFALGVLMGRFLPR